MGKRKAASQRKKFNLSKNMTTIQKCVAQVVPNVFLPAKEGEHLFTDSKTSAQTFSTEKQCLNAITKFRKTTGKKLTNARPVSL